MNKLLSLPYLSNEYFDREVNLSVSRSTEFSAGEGIAGDLLSFKTGTILDSTEIRVRHRRQRQHSTNYHYGTKDTVIIREKVLIIYMDYVSGNTWRSCRILGRSLFYGKPFHDFSSYQKMYS